MERDKNGHLKNQVLTITNEAYDELHATNEQYTSSHESLEEKAREEKFKADLYKV